jgi:hypothetical protein
LQAADANQTCIDEWNATPEGAVIISHAATRPAWQRLVKEGVKNCAQDKLAGINNPVASVR